MRLTPVVQISNKDQQALVELVLFSIHQSNLMYLGVFYLEASLQAKM